MVTVNFTGGRCPRLSGKLKRILFLRVLPVPDSCVISAYMISSRSSCGASRFVILYMRKKGTLRSI